MCHPTGSGAGRNFCRGSFFVFLFLLSNVPPRAQADLATKPTGNGLSSLPTNWAREEARELHHISAVELAYPIRPVMGPLQRAPGSRAHRHRRHPRAEGAPKLIPDVSFKKEALRGLARR